MFDFIVIGGGIAGVSAAAALSDLGKVLLLETEAALGYHASGRSAAMFLEGYGNDTVRALNRASAAGHRAAGVLTPRSLLMVAQAHQQEVFDINRRAFGADAISPTEARELWPILRQETCGYAAYLGEVWDLDTDLLLQGFLRKARRNGAEIRLRSPVDTVERRPDGWRIAAGDFTALGRVLVDAAGAWGDAVARLAGIAPLGLQPFRRSMARLPAPGGYDTRAWPFVEEIEETWYAKPDAGALLVSPAEEDPVDPHDAWADDMVIAEGLARYQEYVTEEVTRVETTWAGLRSFLPDRALAIGPDPSDPAFLWCVGQGGYGFQTAPAAARLLADLAGGRAPELPPDVVAALSPGRFAR